MLCDRLREIPNAEIDADPDWQRMRRLDDAAIFEISECRDYAYADITAGVTPPWAHAQMAPPFPAMWFEWIARPSDMCHRVGVLVEASEIPQWWAPPAPLPGGAPGMQWGLIEQAEQRPVRWLLRACATMQRKDGSFAIVADPFGNLLDESGRLCAFGAGSNAAHSAAAFDLPVLLALAMLNTVNRDVAKRQPDERVQSIRQRNGKPPLLSYTTIRVPGHSRNGGGARRGAHEAPKLHIVRGHFKQRATGQFWWHPHIRGDYDRGVSLGTYEVGPR